MGTALDLAFVNRSKNLVAGDRSSNLQFTITHAWSPYVAGILLDYTKNE